MSNKTTPAQEKAYKYLTLLPTNPEDTILSPEPGAPSYFQSRMTELGIDNPRDFSFQVPSKIAGNEFKWKAIFEKSESEDIVINYPSLYGNQETYTAENREENFYRVRWNPNKNRDNKYYQPPGSGIHIFFPIAILDKFKNSEEIETLYMVEGEFKAHAGSVNGIDIIGIGGKDNFKDPDGDLHPDIIAIINKCKVMNLVLLLDGDVLAIKWDADQNANDDVSKRIYGFYNTVKRFREVAKGRVRDAYFSHVSERYIEEAKGLDDLLNHPHYDKPSIVEDLHKLTRAKAFFSCINLSTETGEKLKGYFCLKLYRGVPSAFYARFAEQLGENEFNFAGIFYKNHPDDGQNGGGLQMVKSAESFNFIRVGCDFFKLIKVPNTNKEGVLDDKRVPWRAAEINRDFVQGQGMKNFFRTIKTYDAFCNVPNNTSDYQPVIENCYNLYSKIEHEPEPGNWDTIREYLKHVFGEASVSKNTTNLDMALDYMTLLYLKPRQKLPILCLVNKKKNTGKSTFLFLLKEIFQANATFIGNEELKDHLNDDWADKLVVGIDEGFIDKKTVLERLKSMSTNNTIKLRGMYAGRQEIAFFAKFVLTSNDETNFVAIDDDEVRFWVNKVPVLTKDNPDLLEEMIKEIPAFLDHLATRPIMHKKLTRHWFEFKLLETDALKNVKSNSASWLIKELKETMKDEFFKYRYHTLVYTIKELVALISSDAVKFRKDDITKQLEEKFGYTNKHGRYTMPMVPEIDPSNGSVISRSFEPKHGRYFEFKVEDFLNEVELMHFAQFYKKHEISDFRKDQLMLLLQEDKKDDMPF